MTRVYRCKPCDVPFLVNTAVEFNDKYYGIPINRDKAKAFLTALVESSKGIAFRTEHGAIIGMLTDDPFRDQTVLVELGWYATDRTGMTLLAAFEADGRDAGANEIRMTTLQTNAGVALVLKKRGYEVVETSHRLKL